MLLSYAKLAMLGSLSILFLGVTAEQLPGKSIQQEPPCSRQINYLSDTDGAYKYLENQQREIYTQNPGLADPFSREELNHPGAVRTLDELKKRALAACPDPAKRDTCALDPDGLDKLFAALPCMSLPTRFESPLFSYGLNLYVTELDKVRATRFPISSNARFGSLPTGIINAQALLPAGSKDPVVIVNRDIFFFTGALSKSISDAIPISSGEMVRLDYSEGGIRKRLHEHPYIVANFSDAMSRIVLNGSSRGALEVTLDDDHNHLHARLVSSMDLFIIAHEDAHVILKHVSDQSVPFRLAGGQLQHKPAVAPRIRLQNSNRKATSEASRNQAGNTSVTLKVQVRTRNQEIEADALGFKLMMWVQQNSEDLVGQLVAAAAPYMVFRIMDAVDAYGREVGGWEFSDPNHPPAADRLRALMPIFDELARDSQVLQQADFRAPFDVSLKILLSEADPQIRQKLGLPPKRSAAATSQGH